MEIFELDSSLKLTGFFNFSIFKIMAYSPENGQLCKGHKTAQNRMNPI